ncbi:BgTH12-07342 [Blumeria graminis f. sp. triticale]|uniref:BgTH12-07342 n=1 Tax=Blumeria graminis f. sp. triticale TaxID=1689686 RepID=A0A9W4D961_BLUGR|nr:BgTH12-07342 [Blumeria graminis f. sp. triticale]
MKFLSLSIITVAMDLLCATHSFEVVTVANRRMRAQNTRATNTETALTHEFACMNKVIQGTVAINAINQLQAPVSERRDNGRRKKVFIIDEFTQDIVSIKYFAQTSMNNRYEKVISVMNNLMAMPCEMLARGTANTINDKNMEHRRHLEMITVQTVAQHLADQED